jgi:hypothetical protein
MEPTEIEPNQETQFTLDFQDPSSGESIMHVNYNFEIKDENGETVQSMTDLHTHSGSDEQTVTFDTIGRFDLVVTIIGTGIDPPFDTTQSGTAQTAITVGQQQQQQQQQLPASAATADGNNKAISTEATTISNNVTNTSTSSSPSGIELSPQPIWEEEATTTGMTPINQTHSIVTFIGNGTLTVPDTGQTVNMTNNGTAIISPVTGSNGTVTAYGKENVFSSEDSDSTAITFYEIVQYDPATFQGKGIVIAVFDGNATGSLAPFNGIFVAGTHDEDPNTQAATITLWEWESGIGNNLDDTPPVQQGSSPLNTNTTTSKLPQVNVP